MPRRKFTDEEKAAKKAAHKAATARSAERPEERQQREAEAQAAKRFKKQSTPHTVAASFIKKTPTLEEYRAGEALGLVPRPVTDGIDASGTHRAGLRHDVPQAGLNLRLTHKPSKLPPPGHPQHEVPPPEGWDTEFDGRWPGHPNADDVDDDLLADETGDDDWPEQYDDDRYDRYDKMADDAGVWRDSEK